MATSKTVSLWSVKFNTDRICTWVTTSSPQIIIIIIIIIIINWKQ